LRDFEEIEISRQRCRGDCEQQGEKFLTFALLPLLGDRNFKLLFDMQDDQVAKDLGTAPKKMINFYIVSQWLFLNFL
jgi:hypothetical protein